MHKCAARQCQRMIALNMLMCAPHWRAVPALIRRAVWQHYRDGQETDGKITFAYRRAMAAAVDAVSVGTGGQHAAGT